MSDDVRMNLYDFFGFPNREQRDEARKVIDVGKLQLISIEDTYLKFFDTFFEQYHVWSNDISNFSSHLGLHFFLLYYQFTSEPLDRIDTKRSQTSEMAHKIFFDTFAEDTSLYLISYFDKHLEMFNDLYRLQKKSGKKHKLSRKNIIDEMAKIDELKGLVEKYQQIEKSKEFKYVRSIRNNFVHNKSSAHYGMSVSRVETQFGAAYVSGNAQGISTKETYGMICSLLKHYEEICMAVNEFMSDKASEEKETAEIL